MPINAHPRGIATACHILLISSAGMVIMASSCAYSQLGQRNSPRKASDATIPIVSISAWCSFDSLETTAVMRMCAPRRNATTAPSMDSQRRRACAEIARSAYKVLEKRENCGMM